MRICPFPLSILRHLLAFPSQTDASSIYDRVDSSPRLSPAVYLGFLRSYERASAPLWVSLKRTPTTFRGQLAGRLPGKSVFGKNWIGFNRPLTLSKEVVPLTTELVLFGLWKRLKKRHEHFGWVTIVSSTPRPSRNLTPRDGNTIKYLRTKV